jgi:hypothetical protein
MNKRRRRIRIETRSLSKRKRQRNQNMRILIYAAGLAMVVYIISILVVIHSKSLSRKGNQLNQNGESGPSIIRTMPPELSNKIAAGEVIQRPASVAKELLDNAFDAGADHIKLIVQQAGRTLIQVD